MKLHCMVCSCQGTHISEDSAIATIDESKLKLPLTPEMFTSINPDRDIPAPWLPGTDWQSMKCPRGRAHLPWGINFKDIDQAIRDGGPKQILTDKGMISTNEIRSFYQGQKVVKSPEFEAREESEAKLNPNVQMFTCKKCGRVIKSRLAFSNHQKACKGKLEKV